MHKTEADADVSAAKLTAAPPPKVTVTAEAHEEPITEVHRPFEVQPWTWCAGKYVYYLWPFTDPVFKIRLQEDPASHLVFVSLTLSYPKPTNDNVSALCSIGEMYDQLQDLTLTWDIALVSARSQLAVEPIKVNGYKGIKVNTAYETKPIEW